MMVRRGNTELARKWSRRIMIRRAPKATSHLGNVHYAENDVGPRRGEVSAGSYTVKALNECRNSLQKYNARSPFFLIWD